MNTTTQSMIINPALSAPIHDFESAKAWIRGLRPAGLEFHFEDSPETIVNEKGQRTFTDDECVVVRERVEQLYSFDWGRYECPIGYMIEVSK
jgi:hypothetical protein